MEVRVQILVAANFVCVSAINSWESIDVCGKWNDSAVLKLSVPLVGNCVEYNFPAFVRVF